MFAGPNGSGKSTIKAALPAELLGYYINPDEIEQGIRERLFLDLSAFDVATTPEEILPFFRASALIQRAGLEPGAQSLSFFGGKLFFPEGLANSYFASVAADFVRRKLVEKLVEACFLYLRDRDVLTGQGRPAPEGARAGLPHVSVLRGD